MSGDDTTPDTCADCGATSDLRRQLVGSGLARMVCIDPNACTLRADLRDLRATLDAYRAEVATAHGEISRLIVERDDLRAQVAAADAVVEHMAPADDDVSMAVIGAYRGLRARAPLHRPDCPGVPLCTLDRRGEPADVARSRGWVAGDVIEGDEGGHIARVTIVSVGHRVLIGVGEGPYADECGWVLCCRCWGKVTR